MKEYFNREFILSLKLIGPSNFNCFPIEAADIVNKGYDYVLIIEFLKSTEYEYFKVEEAANKRMYDLMDPINNNNRRFIRIKEMNN